MQDFSQSPNAITFEDDEKAVDWAYDLLLSEARRSDLQDWLAALRDKYPEDRELYPLWEKLIWKKREASDFAHWYQENLEIATAIEEELARVSSS